jgi:hypothetical protein
LPSFKDELTDQINLRWAWEKVRRHATPGDNWFDEVEVAAFELALESNLRSIASELRTGRYRIRPFRPLPYPKDPDKSNQPRVRQVFQIAIRDQVAWTAVVNIIGSYVDSKMPPWSYDNRLYRPIWVDEDPDGTKHRKIGRYRRSSGQLYLPFGQSWPVFRRHVYLTTRAMAGTNEDELDSFDESTREELEFQKDLKPNYACPFVLPEYWQNRAPAATDRKLYWCSVDVEKFYPSVDLTVVRQNIIETLPEEWKEPVDELIASMLKFPLQLLGWSPEDLRRMNLRANQRRFRHIPTGLYVAGFLANAALLKVDRAVSALLDQHPVAHFRFVDDHVVIAYSFEELVKWVRDYASLLSRSVTGLRLNRDKCQPEEISPLVFGTVRGQRVDPVNSQWMAAKQKCELDPKFPTPLMTKTLALISAIARTDFALLESAEMIALTDQLEHLLLVNIPGEEVQEKTRLSFAATKLTRLAECRLANPESETLLSRRRVDVGMNLKSVPSTDPKHNELVKELAVLTNSIDIERKRTRRGVDRAFQLLRKVLFERPDRTRLWTRALLMCRLTGVSGLKDILEDIQRERKNNPLTAQYLYANMLSVLGVQALIAARIVEDRKTAHWRRDAALRFLGDLSNTRMPAPDPKLDRWFVQLSWRQFCFGLYSAEVILRGVSSFKQISPNISFPQELVALGSDCIVEGGDGHPPEEWAWFGARNTLRDLDSHASKFVVALGSRLKASPAVVPLWRFFPLDIPGPVLALMVSDTKLRKSSAITDGWWYDTYRSQLQSKKDDVDRCPQRVRRLLQGERQDVSLYDWCEFVRKMSTQHVADPRCGEWSTVEVVRQIAGLLAQDLELDPGQILKKSKVSLSSYFVHPGNFRIPRGWMAEEPPSWENWKLTMRRHRVRRVPRALQIKDNRYTPILETRSPLFTSLNPVRGLGLVLYGILKKTFDLPALWNGPGHSDVLKMLPRLLSAEMTCSSWTLGILRGCLEPRTTETLLWRAYPINPIAGYPFDDDSSRGPFPFSDALEVSKALALCESNLEDNQISTMNQRARQLTPVSIRQLTDATWTKDFEGVLAGEEEGVE